MEYFPESVGQFMRAVGPEPTDVQRAMAAYAEQEGFPIIGPEAGGILRILARVVGAESIFEFGSGFGYSATWFAQALGPGDQLVLTEYDAENAERASEYLSQAGVRDRVTIEVGDATEIIADYPGPFDIVLFDHEKSRYPEAIPLVADKIRPGGLLLADNMMRGPMDFADVVTGVTGGQPTDSSTQGVVEYLERMHDSPEFDATVLPVGNGVAMSVKTE